MTTRGRTVVLGLAAAAVLLTAPGTATAQTNNVTFSRDVAPIFQRSCQGCHRAGQMGPMSLMTYEEVRPWASRIRSKVVNRVMPPWHLDKTVGIQEFQNDISLSDAEIDIIVDHEGRVWFGLSNNLADIGIFATMAQGPAMRGPLEPLPPLMLGGPSTLA